MTVETALSAEAAIVQVIPPTTAGLYQQVLYIREHLDLIEAAANQAKARQDKALGDLSDALHAAIAGAHAEILKLQGQLSDVAAGNAPRELVGLCWIVIGALCSAVAGLPL